MHTIYKTLSIPHLFLISQFQFTKPTVMDTYMSFINNLKKAKETIKTSAASRPAFAKFLDAMARDHKGKLSLDNLLIKPVQKFPSYKLLIQRLIKHTGKFSN